MKQIHSHEETTGLLVYGRAASCLTFTTVAPGIVDTPLQKDDPKDFLRTLFPRGSISDAQEIVDAVVFLAEAPHMTGEVL